MGHCRQYLIKVMEWNLAFSGSLWKQLTSHSTAAVYLIFSSPCPLLIILVSFSLASSFLSTYFLAICHAVFVCYAASIRSSNWSILSPRLALSRENLTQKQSVANFLFLLMCIKRLGDIQCVLGSVIVMI